jgi:aryl-alcohol dehydrogenase-like predicted oxidoreductase
MADLSRIVEPAAAPEALIRGQQPVVTAPIIGAAKPHHLDDAVAAFSIGCPEKM